MWGLIKRGLYSHAYFMVLFNLNVFARDSNVVIYGMFILGVALCKVPSRWKTFIVEAERKTWWDVIQLGDVTIYLRVCFC